MKKIRFAALLAILPLLFACSREQSPLLDTVPSTASSVVVFNLHKVASAFGIKVSDGIVTLPDEIKAAAPRLTDDDLKNVASLAEAIDIKCVVLVGPGADFPGFCTFHITHQSALTDLLTGLSSSTEDGFTVTDLPSGNRLFTKDSQGWLFNASATPEMLANILKNAENAPISQFSGVAEQLSLDDTPMAIALNLASIGSAWNGRWGAGPVAINDSKISARINLITTDGTPVNVPGVRTLATDFLRYTPADANFVMAIGATPETDWSVLGSVMSAAPSMQLSGMAETVLPFLQKADGTVALAADFNAADPTASGATFLLMVHMPQADADAALADIENRMRAAGATPHRSPAGVISIGSQGAQLNAGIIDGYLAVASFPLVPTQSNQLNPYFLSRKAAAVLSVPAVPMAGINSGLTLSVEVEDSSVSVAFASETKLQALLASLLALVI